MNYRPEIDGLRAFAVLIVLVFHLNSNFLPGGFIGVDIFFVISGFLITSIIHREINEGTFSIKKFYVKRMKRLLPLFFSVVVFTLFVGYFLFLPADYKALSNDVLFANLFLANVKYALNINYFIPNSQVPLLHLWSLSVEEQFYLVFPLIFIFLSYKFKKSIPFILIVLFLFSLVLAEYLSATGKYSNYSYLLLPSRAWEMLAGCLLAIFFPKPLIKGSNITSIFGVILLVLGLLLINKQSVFPGFITCLPVFGTLLILKSGGSNYVGRFLSNPVLTYVGLASYSIYMWHYPIIAFFKSINGIEEVNIIQGVILSLFILGIGFLSKHWIEDFFRFNSIKKFKNVLSYYFVIPLVITCFYSLFVFKSDGLLSRFGIGQDMIVTTTKGCPHNNQYGCYLTDNKDNEQIMLVGDSHAEHFTNFFYEWSNQDSSSLALYVAGGCTFFTKEIGDIQCEQLKLSVKNDLSKFNYIIIANRYDRFYKENKLINEFIDFVKELTESGKKVVVLMQVPHFKERNVVRNLLFNRRYSNVYENYSQEVKNDYELANTKIKESLEYIDGVQILNLNPFLEVNNTILVADENDKLLYLDDNHLSAYASTYILEKINKKYGVVKLLDFIFKT